MADARRRGCGRLVDFLMNPYSVGRPGGTPFRDKAEDIIAFACLLPSRTAAPCDLEDSATEGSVKKLLEGPLLAELLYPQRIMCMPDAVVVHSPSRTWGGSGSVRQKRAVTKASSLIRQVGTQ